jgi:hypothetical protein
MIELIGSHDNCFCRLNRSVIIPKYIFPQNLRGLIMMGGGGGDEAEFLLAALLIHVL